MAFFSKIDRRIFALSLPNVITNIAAPLVALADVAVAGRLEPNLADGATVTGAHYVATVAVCTMLLNIINWQFNFLRMSACGETAQSWGRRDLNDVVLLLVRNLMFSGVLALALMALSPLIRELSLWLIDPDDEVVALSRNYFNIIIFAALPYICFLSLKGWFIGMQNTRTPMFVCIAQNVINITLDFVFVFLFDMGIYGIAWAYMLSNWLGFIMAVGLCLYYYRFLWLREDFMLPPLLQILKSCFALNSQTNRNNTYLIIRTELLVAMQFAFIAGGAHFGSVELTTNAMLMQIYSLFSCFIKGVSYSGEALVGRAIGASNFEQLRSIIHHLFVWGFALAALFSVFVLVAGDNFIALLTDNKEVLDVVPQYFIWALIVPFISVVTFMWDGIYVGSTSTLAMLISMSMGTTVFFSCYFTLIPLLGNHGLWISLASQAVTSGLVSSLLRKKYLPYKFGVLVQNA